MENPLYGVLRDKYRVGDHYITAYLTSIFGTADMDIQTFDQKLASNPNLSNWVNYALSTNIRGREFAQLLRPHLPDGARRYLDVGSAYGGFSIGFLELGFEVMGVEYSEKLVNLSRANFKDHNLEDASIKGDILDETLLPRLGKFDVITCIDVIEHVNDVPQAMKNMVSMLNPGGILVLQMPNKDSISNVIADSHFKLFGITLLEHVDAEKFYFCNFPASTMYDVGEYYPQEYYLKLLEKLGCEPSVMPPAIPTRLVRKAAHIPRYFLYLGKFVLNTKVTMPFALKLKVIARALKHVVEFMVRLAIAIFLPLPYRLAIKARFADDAWFIIGTKLKS